MLRFRLNKTDLAADIEKAFSQIRLFKGVTYLDERKKTLTLEKKMFGCTDLVGYHLVLFQVLFARCN